MTSLLLERTISTVLNAVRAVSITRRKAFRIAILTMALYVIGSLLSVVSAQRASNALANTDISSALAGGEAGLAELSDKLGVFDRRYRIVKAWAYPVRTVAKVAVVVPVVDRQRQAAELLLDRIDIDYEAALATIELGRSMFVLQDTALGGSISISDPDEMASLRVSLDGLETDSIAVLEILEQATDVGVRFDALGSNGIFVSLSERMAGQEARLDQVAEFSRLLSTVLLGDLELIAQVSSTFDEVRAFQDGDLSIGGLGSLISDLTASATETRDTAVLMVNSTP
ncbi:MAG: hypothetical protein QF357_11520, partial [Dehalococcoidia bacterium]|nr:hypothetical protein [Dehalococcoidia bacterium]